MSFPLTGMIQIRNEIRTVLWPIFKPRYDIQGKSQKQRIHVHRFPQILIYLNPCFINFGADINAALYHITLGVYFRNVLLLLDMGLCITGTENVPRVEVTKLRIEPHTIVFELL